ncbi:fibropellin-1-like [Ruditapes philippinarum]|uniref:fibropellin-1-like n=1 Tax=Ruditapes philippinarum TaxID=129788 RepID=UPI00295B5226|nr:fibropellin-1-like [Ruditapes philippinarum]
MALSTLGWFTIEADIDQRKLTFLQKLCTIPTHYLSRKPFNYRLNLFVMKDIDECANVTCQNGGICNDYINRFECKCPMGFNGTYCENSLGRVCYNCEGVADDPTRCANRTLCGPGEQCYSEHELDAPGVFTYNLGCVPSKLCSYLENKNFRRRDIRPVQLCYECCDINGCNHHACADYN